MLGLVSETLEEEGAGKVTACPVDNPRSCSQPTYLLSASEKVAVLGWMCSAANSYFSLDIWRAVLPHKAVCSPRSQMGTMLCHLGSAR